jgi:hypothetical protein
LAPAVVEILRPLPRLDPELVFTRGRRGCETAAPVGNFSTQKLELDALMEAERRRDLGLPADASAGIPAWHLHDLRRSVASGMAALGIEAHIADRVLNHAAHSTGTIQQVYQKHAFLAQRRQALERWSQHIVSLVKPPSGNVVRFPGSGTAA